MTSILTRDLAYAHAGLRMLGHFAAPAAAEPRAIPCLFLIHGAFGLTGPVMAAADRLAGQGYAVLALDLWGERRQPKGPAEFGPLMGALLDDRALWHARMAAGVAALLDQPAADPARLGGLGYCFGGAAVLEYLRLGGAALAVASLHGGLDAVGEDWSTARRGGRVLICSGAADPLAKPADLARLQAGLESAGVSWESNLYGGVRHGFTEPDTAETPPFAGYDAWADHRSWRSVSDFFAAALGSGR